MEATLKVKLSIKNFKILKGVDLAELCITSSAEAQINESEETIVETTKAEGKKCPVCWKISKEPCSRHKD